MPYLLKYINRQAASAALTIASIPFAKIKLVVQIGIYIKILFYVMLNEMNVKQIK